MLASAYLNLEKAKVLIADDNAQAVDIVVSILIGFGIKDITRADSGLAAMELTQRQTFDLILTDAHMPGMDGYDFIHWLRRNGSDDRRVTPALVISAHTRRSHVLKARDCGANFIVAKPITPRVLLDRIFWVAKGDRMFVECETYCGPDRRFKNMGPPAEFPDGRRRDDMPIEIGAAESQNMSQDELDQLVRPQRAGQ